MVFDDSIAALYSARPSSEYYVPIVVSLYFMVEHLGLLPGKGDHVLIGDGKEVALVESPLICTIPFRKDIMSS